MMHNTGITSDQLESRALSVDGPQPAWMTLNDARERAFTGEVVFEVDPEVSAYLDNGVVYYAERTSDAPLGRRLLETGVVTIEQLERGTVRVGDVEHLGRLFDRDPSVDRDAVLVVTETATERLIAEVANDATATVRVTAYRHHPSGVHRWFVGAIDPGATGEFPTAGQLDPPILDELPAIAPADELSIEWDDLEVTMTPADLPIESDELGYFDPFVDDEYIETAPVDEMIEPALDDQVAEVDHLELLGPIEQDHVETEAPVEQNEEVRDVAPIELDETVEVEAPAEQHEHVDDEAVDRRDDDDVDDASPDSFDFRIRWPDGSEQEAVLPPAQPADESTDDAPTATDESDGIDESTSTAVAPLTAPPTPPFTETADGELRFDMPPLRLTDAGEASDIDDDVPDDVAEAVRRAISAIESASAEPVDMADPLVDIEPATDADDVGDPPSEAWEVTTEVAAVTAPMAGAFAPPTMDTRAEVMYAREAEQVTVPAEAPDAPIQLPPAHAVASVVFVDDDASSGGGSSERSSALRRLIGSLRRKDH